jgi:hypothetical protein
MCESNCCSVHKHTNINWMIRVGNNLKNTISSEVGKEIVRSRLWPFFYLFVQFVSLLEAQGTASSGLVQTHFCDWKASSVGKWDLEPRIYRIPFHAQQYRILPLHIHFLDWWNHKENWHSTIILSDLYWTMWKHRSRESCGQHTKRNHSTRCPKLVHYSTSEPFGNNYNTIANNAPVWEGSPVLKMMAEVHCHRRVVCWRFFVVEAKSGQTRVIA